MTIFRGSVFRESIFRGSVFNGGVFFNPGHYTFCSYTTNADSQDGTIKLSLPAGKSIVIHWGDGNTTDITGAVTEIEYTNTYAVTGKYDVTVTGDYNDISYLQLLGDGVWSGDVKYLPNNLLKFFIWASGNINTYTGDLANLPPYLTVLAVTGFNTLYGDIADVPVSLSYMNIAGNNTIIGDVADAPVGLTTLSLYGNNTISGHFANVPANITTFFISGNNTIAGDLASAPVGITRIYIQGSNTIADYTALRTWAENQNMVIVVPVAPGGLSTAEVDALLHDLAQVTTWTGSKVVTLTGTNEPRSSASDTDVTTLTNAGVTVTTNT